MLQTIVIGNLGADAEVRETNGKKYVSFRVAHSERVGESERTQWVGCLMNGDGGNLLPWLKRGARVCVIGRLRLRAYSSPTTKQWEAGADVYVETIELVGVRQEITPEAIEREISGGRLDPVQVLDVLRKFADQPEEESKKKK